MEHKGEASKEPQVSKLFVSLCMLGMLLTGSVNTIALKVQNLTKGAPEGSTSEYYYHPFLQTFFMFLGESFCLGIYSLYVVH